MAKERIKVSQVEVKRIQKVLHDELTQSERDEALAHTIVVVSELSKLVKRLSDRIETDKPILTKLEQKEVEDMISIGPSWLNYTRKTKRSK